MENEVFQFEEQICDFEEDLANDSNNIPEDIRDSILVNKILHVNGYALEIFVKELL